ncbi:hypothetical protein NL108_017482 [Boleophthalmus pectinirostris]|nr:hypothetical protein NL108_017482 [Boleophthalmus pectinirostris]
MCSCLHFSSQLQFGLFFFFFFFLIGLDVNFVWCLFVCIWEVLINKKKKKNIKKNKKEKKKNTGAASLPSSGGAVLFWSAVPPEQNQNRNHLNTLNSLFHFKTLLIFLHFCSYHHPHSAREFVRSAAGSFPHASPPHR